MGTKILMGMAAAWLAMPAFAGVTYDASGSADSYSGAGSSGSDSGSLGVALDGPSTSSFKAAPAPEFEISDEASKSLYSFSKSTKHGGWDNWDDWDWDWDWDWDHDWDHGGGGVVPEPGSMLLLGMGLSAVAIRKRLGKK
jgi:hypothetical protein